VRRVVVACVPMAAVVLVVSNLSGSTTFAALALRVVGATVAGVGVFVLAVVWLGGWAHRAGRVPRPPGGPEGPTGPPTRTLVVRHTARPRY
jgi:hypothetical protein